MYRSGSAKRNPFAGCSARAGSIPKVKTAANIAAGATWRKREYTLFALGVLHRQIFKSMSARCASTPANSAISTMISSEGQVLPVR